MGRMSELHHEVSRAAPFLPQPMPLDDWRKDISEFLNFIEAGSSMVARNAQYLVARPTFETLAEDELKRAKQVLQSALAKIEAAEIEFEGKPRAS